MFYKNNKDIFSGKNKKIKIFFGVVVLFVTFFMNYDISLAAGCCVKPTSTGKNSCVSTTDKATCIKSGKGNYLPGDCLWVATNCGADDPDTAASTDGSSTGNYTVSGQGIDSGNGIVQCGRPGGKMCTLCDLIAGFNTIIKYLIKIGIGVALLAMAVGGVFYIVSAGESAMMEMAKSAIKNAAIGFVIVLAAWLIVNTLISALGASGTLGMSSTTTWGDFDCNATGK